MAGVTASNDDGIDARWDIVFDGGSLGNPGRGYGSYRLRPVGGTWAPAVRMEHGARITNNEAEYLSLQGALEALADQVADPGRVAITVYGDSQLVLQQLAGAWRVRTPSLAPFHAGAKKALARFGHAHLVWQRRDRSVALLGH